VTASWRGRDEPPATGASLPSHSPGGRLADRFRTGCLERKRTAGRLTKPPRSGRGRACPSANAKAAGFDQRPSGPRTAFGPEGDRPGRTPDLRIRDQPGSKRCLRASALPPAQKELRLRRGRAGPGFGPGAANQAGPGVSAHGLSGGTEALAEDPAGRENGSFGFRDCQGRKRNASSTSAERRTVRAPALSGSHRGHLKGLPGRTPEDARPGFALVTAPRNRPSRKARFGGTGREGTVGPGSDAGPHYCLGAVTIGENARRIFTRRVSVSVRTRTFSSAPPREKRQLLRFAEKDGRLDPFCPLSWPHLA
jgi:hypothetical protein